MEVDVQDDPSPTPRRSGPAVVGAGGSGDFGDGWDHTIRLEEVKEYDGSAARARVTGGRRACPPEDCGGVPGYETVLAALADSAGATEHGRELLDWLPDGYDPAAYSAAETDELLQLTVRSLGGDGP